MSAVELQNTEHVIMVFLKLDQAFLVRYLKRYTVIWVCCVEYFEDVSDLGKYPGCWFSKFMCGICITMEDVARSSFKFCVIEHLSRVSWTIHILLRVTNFLRRQQYVNKSWPPAKTFTYYTSGRLTDTVLYDVIFLKTIL